MSNSTTYFIAGASRGLGLELSTQLAKTSSNKIYATYRTKSTAQGLFDLAAAHNNVELLVVDLNSEESIESLKLPDEIDIVIMNAGIADSYYPVLEAKRDSFLRHFITNAVGPITLFQQVFPHLSPSARAYFISSFGGSITGDVPLAVSAYGASKAALNYSVKKLSVEQPNITFVLVHPGVLRTDMGDYGKKAVAGDNKELQAMFDGMSVPAEVSAAGVIEVVDTFNKPSDTGKFVDALTKSELPF
ncbi:hypothetical protein OGAPHI_000179 [Ogataea philodendri]|uniref:NAD(P)-binding protein n=1 Tax=Ogataea philodendri TaxID=1378263 RepID=A0A9P8PG77_9ASCO|nr:uncharacterized protein OGAPHI_000179 [Ogataea philodendri]KAH3671477.1 hypothetical protein OGAPHI_000179 [Ogataea philodendri]